MNDLAPWRGWTASSAVEACGCDITSPPPWWVMAAPFGSNGEERSTEPVWEEIGHESEYPSVSTDLWFGGSD